MSDDEDEYDELARGGGRGRGGGDAPPLSFPHERSAVHALDDDDDDDLDGEEEEDLLLDPDAACELSASKLEVDEEDEIQLKSSR